MAADIWAVGVTAFELLAGAGQLGDGGFLKWGYAQMDGLQWNIR